MEKYTMNRRIVHFLYGIGKYKLHCTTPSFPQFHQTSPTPYSLLPFLIRGSLPHTTNASFNSSSSTGNSQDRFTDQLIR